MTTTATATDTQPPVVVNPDVLKAVKEYLKANDEHNKAEIKLESKYWPMVEEALKMVDQDADLETITTQFRAAFDKATEKVEKASRQYTSMRLMSTRVAKIALKGRDFIEAEKQAGKGFWKIAHELETAAKIPTPSALPDTVSDTTNGEDKEPKPAASRRGGKPSKGKASKEPADRIKVDQRTDLDRVLDVLIIQPHLLHEVIEGMVSKGILAYVDLIRDLLEKATLSNDALESIRGQITKKLKGKELKSLSELKG